MNTTVITAIRIMISLVMLYFVYGETGPVTTTAMLLILTTNECTTKWIRDIVKAAQ
jgi:hypothetical protein